MTNTGCELRVNLIDVLDGENGGPSVCEEHGSVAYGP